MNSFLNHSSLMANLLLASLYLTLVIFCSLAIYFILKINTRLENLLFLFSPGSYLFFGLFNFFFYLNILPENQNLIFQFVATIFFGVGPFGFLINSWYLNYGRITKRAPILYLAIIAYVITHGVASYFYNFVGAYSVEGRALLNFIQFFPLTASCFLYFQVLPELDDDTRIRMRQLIAGLFLVASCSVFYALAVLIFPLVIPLLLALILVGVLMATLSFYFQSSTAEDKYFTSRADRHIPYYFIVINDGGVTKYTYKFVQYPFHENLIGSYLSVFDLYLSELFSSDQIELLSFKQFRLAFGKLNNNLVCYIFKGSTRYVSEALESFLGEIRSDEHLMSAIFSNTTILRESEVWMGNFGTLIEERFLKMIN